VISSASLAQQLHELPASPEQHSLHIPGVDCAVMSRHLLFADGSDRFVEVAGDVSGLFGPEVSVDAILQDATSIWRYFRRSDMGVLLGMVRESAQNQTPVSLDAKVDLPGRGERLIRFRMYAELTDDDAVLSTGLVSDITGLDIGPDVDLTALPHESDSSAANTMQGFAQLLQMNPNMSLSAVQRDRLTHIELACRRMEELIDSIRELSLTEPTGNLPVQPLDLLTQIREAITLVTPLADATGISFAVHTPDGPGGVMAEPRALGQVLRNVLSNAVKYNRPGGHVDITIRLQADRCRIAIADEGKGLTAQQLERLFQPFTRLENVANATEGYGLGLVISRSLVYRMAGSIEVWSNPDRGTTFEIELERALSWPGPAAEARDPARVADLSDAKGFSRKATLAVLCVEDDRMNLLLNQMALERVPGVDVQVARDGSAALQMIRRRPPDLVISDMKLPGLSGRDLIRAVNEQGLAPHTTWIAVSADSRTETRQAALREGFSSYWVKPVNINGLMTAVKGMVAMNEAAQQMNPAGDNDV
jgi:CheY-like chemotaxis protein